jgi:hypothetical protein
MTGLTFHSGRLAQVAFVVDDIEAAMESHGRELKIGGWTLFRNFSFETLYYRGQPGSVVMNAAMCFSGDVMYELIEQANDAPSVYRDVIDKRGHGFHHFGFMIDSLDEAIRDYESRGHVVAQYSETANGIRAAYIDVGAAAPGMVEYLEISAAAMETFTPVYETSKAWDGHTHIVNRYG